MTMLQSEVAGVILRDPDLGQRALGLQEAQLPQQCRREPAEVVGEPKQQQQRLPHHERRGPCQAEAQRLRVLQPPT